MTDAQPDPTRPADPVDQGRSDEDRDVSDVGLPHPGDDAGDGSDPSAEDPSVAAALDEVFPPEHR